MAGNTVVVSVLADAKQFTKTMNGIGGQTKGFSKGMKVLGAAAVAATAAVAGAAVAIGTKAVGAASELEQSLGALGSVFKDQTSQMEAFASKASQSVGLAKSEYAQMASVLGSQLKNMGVSSDQLGGKTNDLIKLGADLSAQFGGSTADAVNALSSLMRGERDPIEKYGVSIKQADINAKLAAMGMAGLTGEAAKAANTQATLALLSEQTADALGAFGREAGTFAGQKQRFTATVTDIAAKFGTALMPAVTAVTGKLNTLASGVLNSPMFASILEQVNGFIVALVSGNSAVGGFGATIGTLVSTFSPLSVIFKALAPVLPTLAGAFGELAATLGGALSAILPTLTQLMGTLVQTLSGVFAAVLPVILDLVTQLASVFAALLPSLTPIVTILGTVLTTTLTALGPIIATIAQTLGTVLGNALTALQPVLVLVAQVLGQVLTALAPLIPPILSLVTAVLSLVAPILTLIGKALGPVIQLLVALLEPILGLIAPLVELLVPAIAAVAKVLETVIGWISKVITWFVDLVTGSDDAAKSFQEAFSGIPKFFGGLIDKVVGFFSGGIADIVEFFTNLPGTIVDKLSGLGKSLMTIGKNMIQGLIDGAGSLLKNLGSFLLNLVPDWIVGPFKSALGIHSPSRVFRKLGVYTMQGLELGLSDSRGVRSAIDKLGTEIADTTFDAPTIRSATVRPSAQRSTRDQGPFMVQLSPFDRRLLSEAGNITLKLDGRVVADSVAQQNVIDSRRGRG